MALVCCSQWHTSGGAIGDSWSVPGLANVSWLGDEIAAAFITYHPLRRSPLARVRPNARALKTARSRERSSDNSFPFLGGKRPVPHKPSRGSSTPFVHSKAGLVGFPTHCWRTFVNPKRKVLASRAFIRQKSDQNRVIHKGSEGVARPDAASKRQGRVPSPASGLNIERKTCRFCPELASAARQPPLGSYRFPGFPGWTKRNKPL
jgi:hypothetical protein